MSELIPNFTPHSDVEISDKESIKSHNKYIDDGYYEEAITLADGELTGKGFRASFFNAIENKIKEFQVYLLNKTAAPDEYYSLTEPTDEFMDTNGFLFWIKPLE